METRICKKCGLEKSIDDFSIYSKNNKFYYRSSCKLCMKEYNQKYQKENKEELNKKRTIYREKHPEIYENYKIKYKELNKQWQKKYREKNKEKINEFCKRYQKEHKAERNERERNKRKNNKVYKLKTNIRLMINDAFKRKGKYKIESTENIIGCKVQQLINYLLHTFEDNYGYEWNGIEPVHIDHKKPLKYAKTEEEVIKLCHYTNLQLLKAKDNLIKHDKLDWRLNG